MQGRVVRLTRPTEEDYALMLRWLAPDGVVAPLTGDLAERPTVEELVQLDRSGRQSFLLIRRQSDDLPVGLINYRREVPGCFAIGAAVGDPALWHHGFAADAFIVLLDHLFHTKNARRVQGMVMLFNKHSMRMMVNGGFICEGILRDYCYLDGGWHDAAMFSLLRREFYQRAERHAAMSDQLRLRDLVPEEDKREARRLLAEYIEPANMATSIDHFLAGAPTKDD